MLSGFKTFSLGLALAIGPQVVNYLCNFDFVTNFGLSPNAASVVGVSIIALRAVTSTPMFQAKSNS